MASTSETPPRITLFRGWRDPGKHVWSPFVVKVEARLRFAGVKYVTDAGSPLHAPKGKIPYVEYHGQLPADATADASPVRYDENSEPVVSIADSTLIIKTLTKSGVLPDLNANLSARDKALDLGLRAMLEDKLYFYHVCFSLPSFLFLRHSLTPPQTRERWLDNYYTMRDHSLGSIPYPVRVVVGILAHRKHSAMLHGQGTLRFTNEELTGFKHDIWGTIAGLLQTSKAEAKEADEPFWALGGDQPTEADATLFGFVISVLISTA